MQVQMVLRKKYVENMASAWRFLSTYLLRIPVLRDSEMKQSNCVRERELTYCISWMTILKYYLVTLTRLSLGSNQTRRSTALVV